MGILPDQATLGGGHWGIPITTLPQEKLANTKYRVENRPNTDTALRSQNRSRLLQVASILHVYLSHHACTHYVKDLIAYLLTFITYCDLKTGYQHHCLNYLRTPHSSTGLAHMRVFLSPEQTRCKGEQVTLPGLALLALPRARFSTCISFFVLSLLHFDQ